MYTHKPTTIENLFRPYNNVVLTDLLTWLALNASNKIYKVDFKVYYFCTVHVRTCMQINLRVCGSHV